MINIQGKLFVDIKIDGKSLGGANLVHKIALPEGTPVIAPSLLMLLNDHSGTLTKDLCLTDANEILVTIGKSPEDLETISRQYRVFNVRQIAGQSGPTLQILGIFDAVKYTTEAARDSYSGTTDDVIKQIAEKCSLDYDGPSSFNGRTTNDNQVWLSVGKSRGAFVQQELAKHAYMDDHSAMYACLTSLGVVRYRNIMDVIATPPEKIKTTFAFNIDTGDQEAQGNVYMVSQSKEFSQAGSVNASMNYGSTLVTDGVSGETAVEEKVDVKTGAPYLAINDQVAQTVGRAKLEYGLLDCGNTHPSYARAGYQNQKQLALFSERVSIIVQDPTEVQLLDPVIYKQADRDPNKPVRNTDVYIVIGKTPFVADGTNYGERIELARMSITEKGEAELKASEPSIARESSIPEVTINPTATVAADTLGKATSLSGITKGVEALSTKARESAGVVLNNVKLIQTSVTRYGTNIQSYLEKPAQAVKDIRASAASAKQLVETAKQLRDDVKTMRDGIKQGNVAMALGGFSQLAQSAAYFRPDGVVDSLCSMMGVTQVMQTTASVYNTVATQLQLIREPLTAVENIGQELDSVVSNMLGVVNSYTDIVGDMAGAYNEVMSAVNGEAINLHVPNIELNRVNFLSTISSSIEPVSSTLSYATAIVPSVSDVKTGIANTLQVKDDTRNFMWAPEEGYSAARVALSDLTSKVQTLTDHIESYDTQMVQYGYEREDS